MNLKYCLTGILCLFLKSNAQEIKPLTIGDKVPDVAIKNIYNYPALQSRLSAFNNKLLILDFMATNCSSCIKALPQFSSLQKEYGDKIKILLVTNQSAEKIKAFLHNHAELKLPMIAGDSALAKLFPHVFISHEVWINNGIVKAITHTEYVNSKNTGTVLANEKINWPVKRDLAEFDYSQPLLHLNEKIIAENSNPLTVFYSMLSKNMSDIAGRVTVVEDSSSNTIRTSIINTPIIDLYLDCLGKRGFPHSFVILNVKDSSHFIYSKDQYRSAWIKENTFSFEAVFPASLPEEKRQHKMSNDLDLYLGMNGRMEKRKVECFVIVRIDTASAINTTLNKVLRKIPVRSLVYILNQGFTGMPVIDETGYTQKIFLQLDENNYSNISLLRQSLKKFGLDIIRAEREVEMFVLSDQ